MTTYSVFNPGRAVLELSDSGGAPYSVKPGGTQVLDLSDEVAFGIIRAIGPANVSSASSVLPVNQPVTGGGSGSPAPVLAGVTHVFFDGLYVSVPAGVRGSLFILTTMPSVFTANVVFPDGTTVNGESSTALTWDVAATSGCLVLYCPSSGQYLANGAAS